MKQHHTVVRRTINAWNFLPASAFDCESVSGLRVFSMVMIYLIFLRQYRF